MFDVVEKTSTRRRSQSFASSWKKFRRVVEKFEVGIEKLNHDAVETSSKNLKVSLKRSTRSTSDTMAYIFGHPVVPVHFQFQHVLNMNIGLIVTVLCSGPAVLRHNCIKNLIIDKIVGLYLERREKSDNACRCYCIHPFITRIADGLITLAYFYISVFCVCLFVCLFVCVCVCVLWAMLPGLNMI